MLKSNKDLWGIKVPKKNVKQKLLECVPIESPDYTEVLALAKKGCYFPNTFKAIDFKKTYIVHNRDRETLFTAAKKRIRNNSSEWSSDKLPVQVEYGYLVYREISQVETACSSGIKVGNVEETFLGKASMDIVMAYIQSLYPKFKTFHVLIVKWIRCKEHTVAVDKDSIRDITPLEPQPGCTAHIAPSSLELNDSMTINELYQLNQSYLYEYDEYIEVIEVPELIVPYAVVCCSWKSSKEIKMNSLPKSFCVLFNHNADNSVASSHFTNGKNVPRLNKNDAQKQVPSKNVDTSATEDEVTPYIVDQSLANGRLLQTDLELNSLAGSNFTYIPGTPKFITPSILLINGEEILMNILSYKEGILSIIGSMCEPVLHAFKEPVKFPYLYSELSGLSLLHYVNSEDDKVLQTIMSNPILSTILNVKMEMQIKSKAKSLGTSAKHFKVGMFADWYLNHFLFSLNDKSSGQRSIVAKISHDLVASDSVSVSGV